MTLRLLSASDEGAAYELLSRDPWANVMMMAVIREWGLDAPQIRQFYGFEREGRLLGIASFARDVALYGEDEASRAFGALALGLRPVVRRIISPRREVDAFWEVFRAVGLPVHFDRRQILYRLLPGELRAPGCPELHEARPSELELLVESSAAMNREELGIDPLATEPLVHRARVRGLIERRRLYCVTDAAGVAFQAALHSQTPEAAQIAGVYTRPDRRGQGLATRALAEVCRRKLAEAQGCCLFVNDFNAPARKVYEKIGFQPVGEFRAIFLEEQ